jgi:hypothetical protein
MDLAACLLEKRERSMKDGEERKTKKREGTRKGQRRERGRGRQLRREKKYKIYFGCM